MKNLLFTIALLISIVSFGQTAEEYFRSGIDKCRSGEYGQAISDFSNSIQLYSDKPDLYNKADAYYNRGTLKGIVMDFNGAIADLTKAIELDPNYARLYYQRAVFRQALQDFNGSLIDYNKLLTLSINSSLKKKEVMVGASVSADDNPKRFRLDNLSLTDIRVLSYNNIGTIKQIFKDFRGSISDFNKAIDINPNDAELYYNKAISYEGLKDFNKAISNYNKAVELNPNYTSVYINRSILKEKLGDLKGACADGKLAANLGHTESVNWVSSNCN